MSKEKNQPNQVHEEDLDEGQEVQVLGVVVAQSRVVAEGSKGSPRFAQDIASSPWF